MFCSGNNIYSWRDVWLGSIHGVSCVPCIITSCNLYEVQIHGLRSGLVFFFAMLSVFTLYSVTVYEYRAFTRDHTYKHIIRRKPHAVRRQYNRYNDTAGYWLQDRRFTSWHTVKIPPFSKESRLALKRKKSPIKWVKATLSSGREAHCSSLFHSEIQNEWNYT